MPEASREPETTAPARSGGFPWPPVVLIGILVLASIVAVTVRSLGGEEDGPKVLTDTAFMAAATAACTEDIPPLRPTATDRDDVVGTKEIVQQVRAASDGLARLTDRLRALPVAGSDAPFVAGWLDDWGVFIEAGRRYAAVLDTGDVEAADKAAKTGDPAQARADRFARANGLSACQLRAAFKAPPRRSPL